MSGSELNDFLAILSQLLLIIALPIVIAAAVQHWRAMTQQLRSKVGEERAQAIESAVQTAVQVARQTGIIDEFLGPQIRARAVALAQNYLNDRNVNVDVETLVTLIEAEIAKQIEQPIPPPADTPEARQQLIERAVRSAVYAAEQSGLAGLIRNIGVEKKDYAVRVASKYLDDLGIPVKEEVIDGLIEATLFRLFLAERNQPAPEIDPIATP
ncbi:MAG: hypothetical protein GYB68_19930 [Chloroflexi bacterium]|nr:hypothetical protein [Chloroflexota bacterium]